MSVDVIILASVGVVFSFVIGYLLASNQKRTGAFRMESEFRKAQIQLEESLHKTEALEGSLGTISEQLDNAQSEVHRLTALLDAKTNEQPEHLHQLKIASDALGVEREARSNAEAHVSSLRAQLDDKTLTIEQLKTIRTELQAKCDRERALYEHQFNLNRELSNRAMDFEVRAAETNLRYLAAEEKLAEIKGEYDQLLAKHQNLVAEDGELRGKLAERDREHSEKLALFDEHKRALSDQFRLLANDILDSKVRILQETNNANLGSLMVPFQQSIDNFKREVSDIHFRQTTQQGELRRELEVLKDINQRFNNEARELSLSIKGQKKMHGNWGELALESVLENSGLVRDRDFKRYVTVHNENGLRVPDVVVYLPEQRHIIIDAKLSLSAYTRFINASEETEKQKALKEHAEILKVRINELSNREYHKIDGLKSPDVVILFIPIESAFIEAIKFDSDIFQQSAQLNVLIATPTTLLTSLNIVKQIWRFEEQSRNTAQLVLRSEMLFERMRDFLECFYEIKASLHRASEAYENAEHRLVQGQSNVISQLQDLKRLAPSIKVELPSYFRDQVDTANIDNKSGIPIPSHTARSRGAA